MAGTRGDGDANRFRGTSTQGEKRQSLALLLPWSISLVSTGDTRRLKTSMRDGMFFGPPNGTPDKNINSDPFIFRPALIWATEKRPTNRGSKQNTVGSRMGRPALARKAATETDATFFARDEFRHNSCAPRRRSAMNNVSPLQPRASPNTMNALIGTRHRRPTNALFESPL